MERIPKWGRTQPDVQLYHRRGALDFPLVLVVLILLAVGVFFIYDFTVVGGIVPSKGYYAQRQLQSAVPSVFLMWFFSRIDYHRLMALSFVLLEIAIGISIVVLYSDINSEVIFTYIHWERPYLFIPSVSSSIHIGRIMEIVGILIFVWDMLYKYSDSYEESFHQRRSMGAGGAYKYRRRRLSFFDLLHCFLSLLLLIAMVGFLIWARVLRSALVLYITVIILLFLVSKWLGMGMMLLPYMILLMLAHAHPEVVSYYEESLLVWLDPFLDPSGKGFHAVQSIYAIADGGAFGVGLGRGTMRYAVEDAYAGAILSAITQEIGLVGIAALLGVYLFFLLRAVLIANRAADRRGFYLASAITVRYCVMLVLCLADGVGYTFGSSFTESYLPFLSYGGSSLLLECSLIGILLSIGRRRPEIERKVGI